MKNILVIAAHPDDEILGLGGTMKKYADQGHAVHCCILGEGATSREAKRDDTDPDILNGLHRDANTAAKVIGYKSLNFSGFPDNRLDSMDLLDIVKEVEKQICRFQPEAVYTHHHGDLNIDHRIAFNAVLTACRPVGDYCVKEIYCFEAPSSTEWSFGSADTCFRPNVFVDIEDTLDAKLNAMKCYRSEIRSYPHPRSIKALEIIAARWGATVGKKFAEAFELIRKVE